MRGNEIIKKTGYLLPLLLLGFLVYSNTLQAPFYFDDIQNISDNPAIRLQSLSWHDLKRAAAESPVPNRPVANISFGLNYYFSGYDVVGFHLVNISLHILTSFFLFFLFGAILETPAFKKDDAGPLLPAFFAAMLWLVHPLQTQSVTYVVQRMNSMASMFVVLAMLCYLRGRQTDGRFGRIVLYSSSFLAGLLALGSKEIAITLPFFILLLEWFFLQDLSLAWAKKRWPIFVGLIVFGLIAAFIFLGSEPLTRILGSYRFKDFTLQQRLLTESRIIFIYLGLFLLPLPGRFSLEHEVGISHSLMAPPQTLLALAAIVAILIAGVILARRQRLFSFTIFWFFGNQLLESTVIPLELFFEHRMYLPSMFLCLSLAFVCFRYLRNKRLAAACMLTLVLLLSFSSYARNSMWSDPLEFHRSNVRNGPNNWRAHYNYGIELYKRDEYRQAVQHFSEALRLEPRHLAAHQDLGLAYTILEEYEQALHHFAIMQQAVPDYPDTYYNLGYLFRQKGEKEKAVNYFLEAARLDPENINTHIQLGYLFAGLGNFEQAIGHFQMVLQKSPAHQFEMLNTLGIMHAEQGNFEQAVWYFSQALLINPDHKQLQNNLELARRKMQQGN